MAVLQGGQSKVESTDNVYINSLYCTGHLLLWNCLPQNRQHCCVVIDITTCSTPNRLCSVLCGMPSCGYALPRQALLLCICLVCYVVYVLSLWKHLLVFVHHQKILLLLYCNCGEPE
jgi:hypothetical protein